MAWTDAFAPVAAANREIVYRNTWGHLAPLKNKTYQGRVVFAFGCYDCGELNPTVLSASFDGLDDSPWLYDALGDFLEAFTPGESGAVLEWTGTLRNYQFKGSTRTILNATKGDPQ